jgi:hypothetical protein
MNHPMKTHNLFCLAPALLLIIMCYAQDAGINLRRISGQGNGGMNLELKQGMYDSILQAGDSWYAHPVYKQGKGPVDIEITNLELCPDGSFTLTFTGLSDTSHWRLYSQGLNETVMGDSSIYCDYSQQIPDWGMRVTTRYVENPGEKINSLDNGYLTSSIQYADSSKLWLSFVPDFDGEHCLNWIRSGNLIYPNNQNYNDWYLPVQACDYFEVYENLLWRTWSPYVLAASFDQDYTGPAYSNDSKLRNDFQKLSSIDLVITNDRSKWSRCCVIETCNDSVLSEGNAEPYTLRNHASVNAYGDTGVISPDPLYHSGYISPDGMGWFPGFAINVETGERLNIMFGENSWLASDNGRDMMWNPSDEILTNPLSQPVFGGFHYIYIMGAVQVDTFHFPPYDACQYIHQLMASGQKQNYRHDIFGSVYWTAMPLSVEYQEWLSNECTIKMRVTKKYNYFRNEELPAYRFQVGENSVTEQSLEPPVLFPNPVSGSLYLQFDTNKPMGELRIIIRNIAGMKVDEIIIPDGSTTNEIKVNQWANGLYFVEIFTEEIHYVKKIVVKK